MPEYIIFASNGVLKKGFIYINGSNEYDKIIKKIRKNFGSSCSIHTVEVPEYKENLKNIQKELIKLGKMGDEYGYNLCTISIKALSQIIKDICLVDEIKQIPTKLGEEIIKKINGG